MGLCSVIVPYPKNALGLRSVVYWLTLGSNSGSV